jgi:hypothetical protein
MRNTVSPLRGPCDSSRHRVRLTAATPVLGGVPLFAIAVLILSISMSPLAAQTPPMTYIYNGPESVLDLRYQYQWEILRTALERTTPKWGPFRMIPSEFMSERRQTLELRNATGNLTLMYLSTTPELEKALIPIRIPVDRNLAGYCVFLIRKGEEARFANLTSLAQLRDFKYGLGLGWIDVAILRANDFHVVTGSSYNGLFEMLVQKRFDVFPRSVVEVLDEYDQRKLELPALVIERELLFYYPLPMYFWFSKTDGGRRLATRAEAGMRMMIADGTYDRIFDKYQRPRIERLRLKQRRLFVIDNPFVSAAAQKDRRFLFNPKTWK